MRCLNPAFSACFSLSIKVQNGELSEVESTILPKKMAVKTIALLLDRTNDQEILHQEKHYKSVQYKQP